MNKIRLRRIHGDNIIEGMQTLALISKAYGVQAKSSSKNLYFPAFTLTVNPDKEIAIEILSGHDLWGININDEFSKYGAPLREAADSYVILLAENTEELLFAVEYCSALPAGNNAWQKSSRAINKSGIKNI